MEQKNRCSRPPIPDDDREDRISSLPNDLLLSIVSSLPLREWSALSTVSRRWRCLVRLLPRLDSFRYESAWHYDPPLLPRAFIRRFHLVDRLREDLIRHAGDAAAEELVMDNRKRPYRFLRCMPSSEVPNSVFHIKTLRLLSTRDYDLVGGSHWWFDCPLLRTLKIESGFISGGAITSILASCRRLENLHIVDVRWGATGSVEIHSESLKNLWLRPLSGASTVGIGAPNLEVLILDLDRITFSELTVEAPKVQELRLHISDSTMKRARRVLLAVKEVTSFTLNAGAANCLASECVDLERFEKMNILKISVDIGDQPRATTTFLVNLLEKCPRLSQLDLQVSSLKHASHNERIINFLALRERLKKLECLHHHLKDVSLDLQAITYFEVKLLRVISTGATALQRLLLQLPDSRVSRGIRAILSSKAPRNKESYTCGSRRTIKMEF